MAYLLFMFKRTCYLIIFLPNSLKYNENTHTHIYTPIYYSCSREHVI